MYNAGYYDGAAQFYDRDTDPAMAKEGMKGFEFMVHPDRIKTSWRNSIRWSARASKCNVLFARRSTLRLPPKFVIAGVISLWRLSCQRLKYSVLLY